VFLGADIGGNRHLADIEFEAAHHAAERLDDHRDVFEFEIDALWLDRAVFQGTRMSQGLNGGFQLAFGHAPRSHEVIDWTHY
jgi:hypothetical protein